MTTVPGFQILGRAGGPACPPLAFLCLLLSLTPARAALAGEPALSTPQPAAARAGEPAPALLQPTAAATTPAEPASSSPPPASPGPLPADPATLARTYRATGQAPTVERAGSVLVPYGHGRPVLRCAPLRACVLELEPGETVLATATGDSERWLLQLAPSGPAGKTPLLVLKPTACNLASNLVVATDRRLYEIGLDAPPCRGTDPGQDAAYDRLPYTGLTRFYYPDELVQRWAHEEDLARQAEADRAAGLLPLAASRLASLNFDYSWSQGRRFPWAPTQVFDDGQHTYIVLPQGVRAADQAPALFLLQPDGALGLLNYHLDHNTLVADRVLDHAVLALSPGRPKDADRLEIQNHAGSGRRDRQGS